MQLFPKVTRLWGILYPNNPFCHF